MSEKTKLIEWANAGLDDILWAYPQEDIKWGSAVVVHEYENAIFMKDGKLYDVLKPGRHSLTAQNLPLLTRAFRFVAGSGEAPFKATIVFVALKQFKGRFGTNTRVKLGPNTLWPTELQSYGNFWFKISNPVLFLTQLAGAIRTFTMQDVTNFIRSFFNELFIQELAKYSATDVLTKLEEVSKRIKADVVAEAFKQRGLELVDLKVEGVSLPFFEKLEKEDPTYGVPLMAAIMKGNDVEAFNLIKTVESMRAIAKSPGAGAIGALSALPQAFGTPPQRQAIEGSAAGRTPQQLAQTPSTSTHLERLKELKRILDEGLITQEEFDHTKKQILEEMKPTPPRVTTMTCPNCGAIMPLGTIYCGKCGVQLRSRPQATG